MSRFFPHTPFAEDQPLSHTILATHVLTRGATTGAIVGVGIFGAQSAYRRLRPLPSSAAPPTAGITPPPSAASLRLLRSAGTGTAVGTALLAVALAGRMRGREGIEWQDRAWRLLENPGQRETDDWTYGGAAAGLLAVVASRGTILGWRGVVGGAGLGSVVGVVGYMGWRYGVKGGKFEER